MKAIVIHGYGGPDVLKFEDVPDPTPDAGEVLVRIAASSVNPFDYKLRSGAMKEKLPISFPAVLGVDLSGTVESAGPGVSNFQPGDKVFAHAMGGYAELCKLKATDLARVPEGLDLAAAASLPTIVLTGAQLADLALGARSGPQTVLVTGAAGMVGRSAVYVAKQRGATVIAGVLRTQIEQANELGADQVLALDDPEAVTALDPLDAIADTINGPTADVLLAKVKDGGMFASTVAVPSRSGDYPKVTAKYMQVVPDPARLQALAEAVLRDELKIPLGQSFPLRQADQAHAAAERGSSGKILILVQ